MGKIRYKMLSRFYFFFVYVNICINIHRIIIITSIYGRIIYDDFPSLTDS